VAPTGSADTTQRLQRAPVDAAHRGQRREVQRGAARQQDGQREVALPPEDRGHDRRGRHGPPEQRQVRRHAEVPANQQPAARDEERLASERDRRGGVGAIRGHQREVEREVDGKRGDAEPQHAHLAARGDERVAEQSADPRGDRRAQQQPQGRSRRFEVVPRDEPRQLGGEHQTAGRDRDADRHEHVGGRVDDPRRGAAPLDDEPREQREDRGHDDGGEQGEQLVDPVGERVEPDFLKGPEEREDEGVGAEVDLVDRERDADRNAGDDELAPHLPIGARPDGGHPAHEADRHGQRNRGADGGGRHDREEAEVGGDHHDQCDEGRETPGHVGRRRPPHLQARLEHRGDRRAREAQ
jgi:hypothetical protein